jgi:hypothetical protein
MKARDSSVVLVFMMEKHVDEKENIHFEASEHERLRGLTEEIEQRKAEAVDVYRLGPVQLLGHAP